MAKNRINMGMVGLMIGNRIYNAFNTKSLDEVRDITQNLLDIVTSSPILETEFKIFNNLKNKHIEDGIIASRYIDNNIKLMEVYTLKEIDIEHEKLKNFINESESTDENLDLYVAINNLIVESLKDNVSVDVDVIHESYSIVLNHIKNNKSIENIIGESHEIINEDVIEIAIEKFNEKYDNLDENDKSLIQTLIKSNDADKKTMLENYKSESLSILEKVDKTSINERVEKTIEKLNGMKYDNNTIDDDIISLHELKKALI